MCRAYRYAIRFDRSFQSNITVRSCYSHGQTEFMLRHASAAIEAPRLRDGAIGMAGAVAMSAAVGHFDGIAGAVARLEAAGRRTTQSATNGGEEKP